MKNILAIIAFFLVAGIAQAQTPEQVNTVPAATSATDSKDPQCQSVSKKCAMSCTKAEATTATATMTSTHDNAGAAKEKSKKKSKKEAESCHAKAEGTSSGCCAGKSKASAVVNSAPQAPAAEESPKH